MGRQAYVYSIVLEYLEANKGLHSTDEIVQATHVSYASIARVVRQLSKEKRVKKRHGPGHSYLYEFVTHEVSNLPVGLANKSVPSIPSEFLKRKMNEWIKDGWNPNSMEAAQTLVTTLSQLCQLQWMAVVKGTAIDQFDLDHCKTKIANAKALADSFAGFFAGLLATDDLWDSKKLSIYMLEGESDPQAYLEHARRVNEVLPKVMLDEV